MWAREELTVLQRPKLYRTHSVRDTLATVGQEVVLSGWVQRRRDLGSVIFIDLRDRSGILQLVFDPARGTPADVQAAADRLRSESVVSVRGQVVERAPETVNPKLETGTIELVVTALELLNTAKTPPFPVQDGIDVDEAVRLRYRYIDLRRPEMQSM
ncbi:MAG: aspartate--tRNA ligase, partial [Alicyclobacillus sp.]|nr:aspartate--tRNA ligase [Alicyclobacillus sp.]